MNTPFRDSAHDGGLVLDGRKQIAIACRRLLEAKDTGVSSLEPALLARISAVVAIESARL